MDNVFEEFLDFPVESLENLETFNSLNEFEQDLLKNESKLCEELRKLDKIIEHEESQKRLPSGKAREKNLAQLCAKKDLSSSGTTVNLSSKTLPADILQSQCLSHSFLSRFTKTNPLKAYKDNEVNVLTKMNVGFYGGPLKRLCDWVNGKNRVKIMLRGRNRINSVVTAFITAFDKHFNLIIRNGTEVFCPSRKAAYYKCKCESHDCFHHRKCFRNTAVIFPGISRKRRLFKRHIKAALIRGDEVISIQCSE